VIILSFLKGWNMKSWKLLAFGAETYRVADETGAIVGLITQCNDRDAKLMAGALQLAIAANEAVDWFETQFGEHDEDSREGLNKEHGGGDVCGTLQEAVEAATVTPTAPEVARQFSKILSRWLTPTQMAEINRLNKTPEYQNGCCATGDFCDSNQAMIDALESLGSSWAKSSDMVNAAWTIARAADFNPNKC
jgi:hypothetical protein